MVPSMNFKKLDVDSISKCSGIFHGENKISNFKGISIVNDGLGKIEGDDNLLTKTENVLIKHE
ncbi:hypothetical protein HNQ94_001575 [Salirhabdus euzebyi]|uniref:Uncharacterized protein n=1 Tax=Salirhabdus euzebyi TaxID=394506 RepID=A0A841Q409_9BACI|nr:hypothetical protein [Salirhabdus euzebyi]MBB6453127.1 hypothetical protein [Salirhabdus euzebyi]